jgi:hypothetical protein
VVKLVTMDQRVTFRCWFRLLSLIFLPFLTQGFAWNGAHHTLKEDIQGYLGSSPAPTEPPSIGAKDLLPRQNGGQICGFANADISMLFALDHRNRYSSTWANSNFEGSAIQCPYGYQCAINPLDYAANCCIDPSYCGYHTACVPYASMGACGASCQANFYITRWCSLDPQCNCHLSFR